MSITDASTPRRFADALDQLSVAQKSGKGAPGYSRWVNRWFGRRLAAWAYVLGLTPNAVTAVSAVFSLAGIAVLALTPPSWSTGLAICFLLLTGYALDSADGQLARLTNRGSPAGEWLDHVVDSAKIPALHLAVLVSTARFFDVGEAWLLLPLGFTVVAVTSFFAQLINDFLVRLHRGPGSAPGPQEPASRVASLAKLPTDFGILCWAFVLLGSPQAFLVAYSLLFVASAAYLAVALPAWYRRMAALGT